MTSTPDPPDTNPYVASEVTDRVTNPQRRPEPGPVAIFFSVIVGLVVAGAVFTVTFFFTCVGLSSSKSLNTEFGMVLVFVIAGLTAVAAFVFTLWGILKIVRALK